MMILNAFLIMLCVLAFSYFKVEEKFFVRVKPAVVIGIGVYGVLFLVFGVFHFRFF